MSEQKRISTKFLVGLASADRDILYPSFRKLDTDEYGTEEVRSLLWRGLIFSTDSHIRDVACSNLGWLGGPENERALLMIRKSPDWALRCTVASALSNYNSPAAFRAVKSMAEQDPHSTVRRWAILALDDQGLLESPTEYFEAMLANESDMIVKIGLWGVLVRLGREDLLDKLHEVLALEASDSSTQWLHMAARATLQGIDEDLEEACEEGDE